MTASGLTASGLTDASDVAGAKGPGDAPGLGNLNDLSGVNEPGGAGTPGSRHNPAAGEAPPPAGLVGSRPAAGHAFDDGRRESVNERADRNFNELLQELRVAQTGVQILFAFLLTLPFTQRFAEIRGVDRWVFIMTLVATAVSTACLIAPVSQHRILFGKRLKPQLVRVANRLAQAGLAFLLVSVVGALFLIIDVVIGTSAAVAICIGIAVLFALLWYVQPIRARGRTESVR